MTSGEPTPERLSGGWWAAGLLLVLLLPTQLWLHQAAWTAGPARLLQSFATGAAFIVAVAIAAGLKRRPTSFLISSVVGPVIG